jgi:hypothetical protein
MNHHAQKQKQPPFSLPSGPLMSFLNGLHPKSNSLAVGILTIREESAAMAYEAWQSSKL